MTKDQFIEAWRHEISGIVVDASVTPRAGAPLAQWLRLMMKKTDKMLADMYDQLQPVPAEQTPTVLKGPSGKAGAEARQPTRAS
jgi:hypothetical protein